MGALKGSTLCVNKAATCSEVKTSKASTKVILEASSVRRAIAATAHRQLGQPCVTESIYLR